MIEFMAMGRYGIYVWSSFGLAFVMLAGNFIVARQTLRQALDRAARRSQTASQP